MADPPLLLTLLTLALPGLARSDEQQLVTALGRTLDAWLAPTIDEHLGPDEGTSERCDVLQDLVMAVLANVRGFDGTSEGEASSWCLALAMDALAANDNTFEGERLPANDISEEESLFAPADLGDLLEDVPPLTGEAANDNVACPPSRPQGKRCRLRLVGPRGGGDKR
jgi:hypothetical protein